MIDIYILFLIMYPVPLTLLYPSPPDHCPTAFYLGMAGSTQQLKLTNSPNFVESQSLSLDLRQDKQATNGLMIDFLYTFSLATQVHSGPRNLCFFNGPKVFMISQDQETPDQRRSIKIFSWTSKYLGVIPESHFEALE